MGVNFKRRCISIEEKVKTAIERLRAFAPPEGYHLAFSGGKDSVVIKALADMAGVKYHAVYRNTGIDPPELVRFIKDKHPDVEFSTPRYKDGSRITMWNLIEKKMIPPTRLIRYCCQYLKEDSGDGKMCVTGVRWAESTSRKHNQGVVTMMNKLASNKQLVETGNFAGTKSGGVILVNDNDDSRRMVESCYKRQKTTLNPIIDWTDDDVWNFIRTYNIPYCSLYDEGWKRIGCIGCPIARQHGREREFARWPKYKALYLKAFEKMLEERKRRGKNGSTWRLATAEDVFNWWMEYDTIPGQIDLFEEERSD